MKSSCGVVPKSRTLPLSVCMCLLSGVGLFPGIERIVHCVLFESSCGVVPKSGTSPNGVSGCGVSVLDIYMPEGHNNILFLVGTLIKKKNGTKKKSRENSGERGKRNK